jgi:hypothetical protein
MIGPVGRMSPTSHGVSRPLHGHTATYIGGPLDGRCTETGWHGLRRDNDGEPIRVSKKMPPHYVLHSTDQVFCWYYVHTSVMTRDV